LDHYDNVCGYNILPKFVNQLIASSLQIIQIDSRHYFAFLLYANFTCVLL